MTDTVTNRDEALLKVRQACAVFSRTRLESEADVRAANARLRRALTAAGWTWEKR